MPFIMRYSLSATPGITIENTLQLRSLGDTERLWYLHEQYQPFHFSLAATVIGRRSRNEWRDALDLLQRRHPLLSARIRKDSLGRPEFFQPLGTEIPLRIVDYDAVARWESVMEEEMAVSFAAENVPLMRVVLIHGADKSILILSAHHSIADGMSFVYVIRDLLLIMSGEEVTALPLPEPFDERVRRVVKSWPPLTISNGAPAAAPPPFRTSQDPRPTIDTISLPLELSIALRKRAREEGTTVHGAITAAFLLTGRTLSQTWRDQPVRLCSPINARPAFDIGEDCGLYIHAGTVTFALHDSGDLWALARKYKRELTPQLTPHSIAEAVLPLREIVDELTPKTAAELTATVFAREGTISNLGVAPYGPQFGDLRLDALWGPSVLEGLEGEQQLGVASLPGGSINILHCSFTPFRSMTSEIARILERSCQ
jgi:hypothetical protein